MPLFDVVRSAAESGAHAAINSAQTVIQHASESGIQDGINGAQTTIQNAVESGIEAGINSAQMVIQHASESGIQDGINGAQTTIQKAVESGIQAGINSIQAVIQNTSECGIQGGINGAQTTIQNAIESGIQAGINNPTCRESVQNLIRGAIHDDDASALRWWDAFLSNAITVSIFGGSITFTVIVQQIQDPNEFRENGALSRYGRESVRCFLSVAWLLFVAALAVASIITLLLTFKRRSVERALTVGEKSWIGWLFHIFSGFLIAVLLGPFMVLSLAVAAYVEVVGWIGCAVTSLTALVALYCWLNQLRKMCRGCNGSANSRTSL
jgi:uncharacterized protein YqgV (UPF0045/DUF77 family)